MGKLLTLEIRDDIYAKLQAEADAVGTSPSQLAETTLEREFAVLIKQPEGGDARTEAAIQKARDQFEHHFGEVDLGYATGSDNESIDADLAGEYGDNHEGM